MPGAGGIAAARAVISSAGADGYTLAFFTNGTAISVPLFANLPFDPLKQFTPISTIGTFNLRFTCPRHRNITPSAISSKRRATSPARSISDAIVVGSTQDLTAEFSNQCRAPISSSCRSAPRPMSRSRCLRNDIQMEVEFYAALKPSLSSGQARALGPAAHSVRRNNPISDGAEAGVPNFNVTSWNALYAPAGTPQPIIDKLNAALREVLADPDLKKRALDLGIDAKGSTPAEMDDADALRHRQVDQGHRRSAYSEAITQFE